MIGSFATLRSPGLCLDLTDGRLDNFNQLQTWQCSGGNNNQYVPSLIPLVPWLIRGGAGYGSYVVDPGRTWKTSCTDKEHGQLYISRMRQRFIFPLWNGMPSAGVARRAGDMYRALTKGHELSVWICSLSGSQPRSRTPCPPGPFVRRRS